MAGRPRAPIKLPEKRDEPKLNVPSPVRIYTKSVVNDECEWLEMKKSTLTYIRKMAKAKNEDKELTRMKLDAVRDQCISDGRIVVVKYKKDGISRHCPVKIKKYSNLSIRIQD